MGGESIGETDHGGLAAAAENQFTALALAVTEA
jgi:hypothetical protein